MAVYTLPEYLWGYKNVTKRYNESPEESFKAVTDQIKKYFDADDEMINKIFKH